MFQLLCIYSSSAADIEPHEPLGHRGSTRILDAYPEIDVGFMDALYKAHGREGKLFNETGEGRDSAAQYDSKHFDTNHKSIKNLMQKVSSNWDRSHNWLNGLPGANDIATTAAPSTEADDIATTPAPGPEASDVPLETVPPTTEQESPPTATPHDPQNSPRPDKSRLILPVAVTPQDGENAAIYKLLEEKGVDDPEKVYREYLQMYDMKTDESTENAKRLIDAWKLYNQEDEDVFTTASPDSLSLSPKWDLQPFLPIFAKEAGMDHLTPRDLSPTPPPSIREGELIEHDNSHKPQVVRDPTNHDALHTMGAPYPDWVWEDEEFAKTGSQLNGANFLYKNDDSSRSWWSTYIRAGFEPEELMYLQYDLPSGGKEGGGSIAGGNTSGMFQSGRWGGSMSYYHNEGMRNDDPRFWNEMGTALHHTPAVMATMDPTPAVAGMFDNYWTPATQTEWDDKDYWWKTNPVHLAPPAPFANLVRGANPAERLMYQRRHYDRISPDIRMNQLIDKMKDDEWSHLPVGELLKMQIEIQKLLKKNAQGQYEEPNGDKLLEPLRLKLAPPALQAEADQNERLAKLKQIQVPEALAKSLFKKLQPQLDDAIGGPFENIQLVDADLTRPSLDDPVGSASTPTPQLRGSHAANIE